MAHLVSSRSSSRIDTPHAAPSTGNEEHLVSALHLAFHDQHHDSREKPHTSLDIALTNEQLVLRGEADNVEPAILSGNVVLHLTEPTAIKQILLVFKGKARVALGATDPPSLSGSFQHYVICSHEWAFLEGERRHNHMLKAGRHLFPFELHLGGSLPSSLVSNVNGGAFISYKLRAIAIRPGLAANLHAMCPIIILRTFSPGSLEYQQTLDIESTWPEKVMYSLMIPHKAWAAGDEITAVVKFSPLAKGVRVASIKSFISETTRMLNRSGHVEKTRNVMTRKHEIVGGHAVPSDKSCMPRELQAGIFNTSTINRTGSLSSSSGPSTSVSVHGSSPPSTRTDTDQDPELHPEEESEFSTIINVPLPASLTPSHMLDPIVVSYRIRWSVLLTNLDGHTSELRCSLPFHVLDHLLLDEARSETNPARCLMLNDGDVSNNPSEDGAQLPSYPSHVRDRGVNFETVAHLSPDLPLLSSCMSSRDDTEMVSLAGEATDPSALMLNQDSYASATSPCDSGVFFFAPNLSGPSSRPSEPASEHNSPASSPTRSRPVSRSGGEGSSTGWFSLGLPPRVPIIGSRTASLSDSRATSPERNDSVNVQNATSYNASPLSDVVTFVHHTNAASRQSHGLFSAMLKPISSLSAAWSSHTHMYHLQRNVANGTVASAASPTPVGTPLEGNGLAPGHACASASAVPDYFTAAHSGASAVPPLDLLSALPTYEDSERDTHAHTRTNDSERAGSISSTSGTPETMDPTAGSAESATVQRSFSDTDLVSHFSRSRGRAGFFQLQMQAMR